MTFNKLIFTIFILTLLGCDTDKTINYKADLIIKGGTIINLTNHGKVNHDQKNKAILIKADTIFDIVDISTIAKDQKNLLDATGKFIIPGLTDGFSVINNQSYANAFLYMGITDVIGVESERRGEFYHNANPSPNIHMLQSVGESPISDEEVIQTIEKHAKNKVELLLIMYGLNPNQVELAHQKAKKYNTQAINLGLKLNGR